METPSYESNLARVLTPMKIDDEALTINPHYSTDKVFFHRDRFR
jgi:hypothetical protein